uniref:SFRICE_032199 n=1 Tax=Spodoptera frugiperda TaxID=7108 RepID=A0A2H1WLB4_SPOFR
MLCYAMVSARECDACGASKARWCSATTTTTTTATTAGQTCIYCLLVTMCNVVLCIRRAICGRIESYLSCLPPPFQLQRPLLSRAASTEARTPARAPSFSVCWLPEVINATTGKLESGQPSLLCKQSMFARWQFLARRLPPLPPDQDLELTAPDAADAAGAPPPAAPPAPPAPLDISDTLLYNEAKQMCPAYQVRVVV